MRYVPEDEEVEFIVTMKASDAWVGLTLGATPGQMVQMDDIVVFHADGEQSYVKDYLSIGYASPVEDVLQDYTDTSVDFDSADELVTVFVRRALDTGDALDFVFQLDTEFTVGYAYSSTSSEVSVKHGTEGNIAVTLNSDGTPLFGTMPSTDEDTGVDEDDEDDDDDVDGGDDDDDEDDEDDEGAGEIFESTENRGGDGAAALMISSLSIATALLSFL